VLVAGESKAVGAVSQNFFNTLFFVFATTRAHDFLSQGNFLRVIENKIHFFLVAFATDF
jgi:hypothetical protein